MEALEQKTPGAPAETEPEFEKPVFTMPLTGPAELIEGQHAHFQARCVPVGDPTLRFEWYCNGVELKLGEIRGGGNRRGRWKGWRSVAR